MAILTVQELRQIRNKMEKAGNSGYTKPEINDAIQAIEDWYEANRSEISTAIDAATPFSFTNPQKKLLGAYWLGQKMGRELI